MSVNIKPFEMDVTLTVPDEFPLADMSSRVQQWVKNYFPEARNITHTPLRLTHLQDRPRISVATTAFFDVT